MLGCACCRSWITLFFLALLWLCVMWISLGHGWASLAGALHRAAVPGARWVLPSPARACRVAERCDQDYAMLSAF